MSIIDLKSAIEAAVEINRFLDSIQEMTEQGTPLKFNDSKLKQPEIHEVFELWSGGDCPVPEDCDVEYIETTGEHFKQKARALRWTRLGARGDIIAYRVTYVPTLTIDDDVDGVFFVLPYGEIDSTPVGFLDHFTLILAGMAYRTREHAETALKWGLLHDVYYTKMGFEK